MCLKGIYVLVILSFFLFPSCNNDGKDQCNFLELSEFSFDQKPLLNLIDSINVGALSTCLIPVDSVSSRIRQSNNYYDLYNVGYVGISGLKFKLIYGYYDYYQHLFLAQESPEIKIFLLASVEGDGGDLEIVKSRLSEDNVIDKVLIRTLNDTIVLNSAYSILLNDSGILEEHTVRN